MASTGRFFSGKRKVIVFILVFLLILAGAFHLFITRYLPPLVRQRFISLVEKGSDSLYRAEVEKLDLSFWGGEVDFTGVSIRADSSRYQSLKASGQLPPTVVQMEVPAAVISGLNIWSLLFSRKINIRQINIQSARVNLSTHSVADSAIAGSAPLWKIIRPGIRSLHIGSLRCGDLQLQYAAAESGSRFKCRFEKCNLLARDIRVDSVAATDRKRLLFTSSLALQLLDVSVKTPDGLYGLQAKQVFYQSADERLVVDSFNFFPAVSDRELIQHFGYQHEIYQLKAATVTCTNFQLPQWIRSGRIVMDTLNLDKPAVFIRMDRNPPPNPYSRKGNYPSQLLLKAKFGIRIKEVKATAASVTYHETNNITGLTGRLVFPYLDGTIENITNEPDLIRTDPTCRILINGGVMQSGKIKAGFTFNLARTDGSFSVDAHISGLNAAQLQTLFKAMTTTDMQSFNLQQLDYTAQGNEDRSTASLRLRYTDLDILLNKVEDDRSFNKRGFLSFLANRLGVYKNNPNGNDPERTATQITSQRDATRSFFNLVWKNLYVAAGEIVLRPLGKKIAAKKANAAKQETNKIP